MRGPADDPQSPPSAEPHPSLCGPNHTTPRPPTSRGFSPALKSRDQLHLSHRPQPWDLPSQEPTLEVLSSEFPHTPSAPSSHAGPGRPNSVPGSWPSRLHTRHLTPQTPQISVLGPHLRTHIPILWIPGSRVLRTPVHCSHLLALRNSCPSPTRPSPKSPPESFPLTHIQAHEGARTPTPPAIGARFPGPYHTHCGLIPGQSVA